jgi:transposase
MTYNTDLDTARGRRFDYLFDQLIKLGNTIPDPSRPGGRPTLFPVSTLFVLLGVKFAIDITYRDLVSLLDHMPLLLQRLGLARPPSYSTLHKALRRIDTRHLHRMYRLLARRRPAPSDVAADCTGISHDSGGLWMDFRMERRRIRHFHGLHAIVDTVSLMILSVSVRMRPGGEARQLRPMLRHVSKRSLRRCLMDRAYLSRNNVRCIAELGADPVVEPKRNSTVNSKGCPAWGRLVSEYRKDPEAWRRVHGYGQRNLAESVFSTLKRRLGSSMVSRRGMERRREVLVMVVLYNVERLNFLECASR